MSTFQSYSHCVAVIKYFTLNLMNCMAILRTWWYALNRSPRGIPYYNHNASVEFSSYFNVVASGRMAQTKWLPLGQDLCQILLTEDGQIYTYSSSCTGNCTCYSKAASVGGLFFQTTICLGKQLFPGINDSA